VEAQGHSIPEVESSKCKRPGPGRSGMHGEQEDQCVASLGEKEMKGV
jgi:hypothetical protein